VVKEGESGLLTLRCFGFAVRSLQHDSIMDLLREKREECLMIKAKEGKRNTGRFWIESGRGHKGGCFAGCLSGYFAGRPYII
jgi:hypothetical protein